MYMENQRPMLVAAEHQQKLPILIIDKKGKMGKIFAEKLQKEFLVVLVTGQELSEQHNIIHIPYRHKIPMIPDNTYSHLFIFYNGEEEIRDMLPAVMKKAQDTQGKLFFITSLPYSSQSLFKHLSQHLYYSLQIILYGEIFSKELTDTTTVSFFLHQAKKYGRIEIPNEGIGKLYPVLLEDVWTALIAVAFGSTKKDRILFVFPKHPISEFSIARMLQKDNPFLKLDFTDNKGGRWDYYIPPEGEYFFSTYPFEEKLKAVADAYTTPQDQQKVKKTKIQLSPKKPHSQKSFAWFVILLIFVLPILLCGVLLGIGYLSLQRATQQAEKQAFAQAHQDAVIAATTLGWGHLVGESLFSVNIIASKPKQDLLQKVAVAQRIALDEVDIFQAILQFETIQENKSKDPKNDFLHALANVRNALISIQKIKAEGELPQHIATKLTALQPVFIPFENTLDALPNLLGFTGKKSYLLLFQNNMELRPGGGFIGSYGIVDVDKGKITEFKVFDVYDADGKLTTHLEPPYALRRYLGASHWFLRDSNFSVDFPQDALQASTLLQLETEKKVDGVIAVDTTFLRNLLTAIGPVVIPDYRETVTSDNFYLLAQTHAEKDFFPGSTQKRDFLRSLLTAMQEKFAAKNTLSYETLVKKLGESIQGKHILLVSANAAVQKLFTVNNLSASLWDGREKTDQNFLDFFGVVDANLGVNKANYYLKRAIDQKVVIDAVGGVQETATVTYANTSTKERPFAGDYKNYVRFVLPANALLKSVAIDGGIIPTVPAVTDPAIFTAKSFLPPKQLEIEASQVLGKETIGFFINVPMGETKQIIITYAIANAVKIQQPAFSYNLRLFKQPGTLDDSYALSFVYPAQFRLVRGDNQLTDVGGKLVYSTRLLEDKDIQVEFSKK